jgi:UDP-N-acetyl-D-glucosamine dehydrogenase
MHAELATQWAERRLTIAVLGLGYVGLPAALACVEAGHHVIGIDTDPARVGAIRQGTAHRSERFRLLGALQSGDLTLTCDAAGLASADVVFICVPTPLEDGLARHDAVCACAHDFARHGRADALVILESTVRPRFVEELRALLGHGGTVALAYAPERIDPQGIPNGTVVRQVPRLVSGVDDDAGERAAALLSSLGVPVHPVPLRIAEFAKLLENSYRLLNVAFIDQFAELCRADNIDPRQVIEAASTKPYGFQTFWPGVGAGGHCVPVDPAFLIHLGRALGAPISLLEHALQANERRPRAVAAAIAAETAPGETVLVVGLTYKAGIPDIRESAAVAVARELTGMNRNVLAFDELVRGPSDISQVPLAEGLRSATSVALLVPQSNAITAALKASGLALFDATGTLAGAKGV